MNAPFHSNHCIHDDDERQSDVQGFVGFRRSHNMKGHSFGFLGLEARTTMPWRHVYRCLEVIPSASNILSHVISDSPPKQEEDTEGDDGLSL